MPPPLADIFLSALQWGAALPTNTPASECIFDPNSRVGVAGDWCAGSSMQVQGGGGSASVSRLPVREAHPILIAILCACRRPR